MKQIIPRVQTTYLKCPTCTNSVTTVTNDRKYPLYPPKERRDWCGSCRARATINHIIIQQRYYWQTHIDLILIM